MSRDTPRAARRRRQRQWAIEAGRRAIASRPTLIGTFDHRGGVAAYVTIEPDPAWPATILRAWRDRQQANTTGRCRCGARIPLPVARPGRQVIRATMDHAATCMVIDQNFLAAVGAWALGQRS